MGEALLSAQLFWKKMLRYCHNPVASLSASTWWCKNFDIFSSPEHAQGELLGCCDVGRPLYVWTS